MDLKETNNKLILVMDRLEKLTPILEKLETEYYQTYYKYLLNAPERSEGAREASSKMMMRNPDNMEHTENYLDVKMEVRNLLMKKEMLIEISKNFRILESRYNTSHIDKEGY